MKCYCINRIINSYEEGEIIQNRCLDCGAKISPGYKICLQCGSELESQKGRTKEEQNIFDTEIKKQQKARTEEFKKRERAKKKINRNKLIASLFICLFISLVSGIIGFLIATYYNLGGWWGFIVGFFAPWLILGLLLWLIDEILW
jgi:hypothetical protein